MNLNKETLESSQLHRPKKQAHPCSVSRPLSRVPFWYSSMARLSHTSPRFVLEMETLVDNGGCSFNGEIKNWMAFRQSLCRESDGKGLGWVYESANVLSSYLQKAVSEMSNKEREAGGVTTDFT